MGFDFRPALKESIKEAGIPRGWSASEHHGRVKLRVRQGAGGAAGQWSKTLPYAWEIGCIGPVTNELKALHKAIAGNPPKSLSESLSSTPPQTKSRKCGWP